MYDKLSKYLRGDKVIWGVVVLLSIISLLAVYSSTGTLAYEYQEGNTVYYFMRHFSFLAIGLLIIYIVHLIPYKYYLRLSQLFLMITIPLLALTLVIGTSHNQASRWLTLPVIGISIQTSDIAKLALIMYTARMLSLKQGQIKDLKGAFLPMIIPVSLVCMLILPANLSTAAILFFTCIIIMFIGRVRFKYLMALIGIGVFMLGIFILIASHSNTESRIYTWKSRIDAYVGNSADNYQAEQAKIAIATGGAIGKGPGNSIQRNFLPNPYSDFIYAIIVEEYGTIGALIILFLYLFLLYRAGVIVKNCNRTFPAFLTIGLAIMLVFQAMINMGVAVSIFPVTGQTLPLVSMGGSSMIFTSTAVGIILSVSREYLTKETNEAEG
jgi:cell division protein FtsW